MIGLTGTRRLIWLVLRRDRIRIFVWVAATAALVLLTAAGVKSLFPTQAAIDEAAAASQHNPAAIAFNGPPQGLDTLGGQVAFQVGALGMVAVALMSLFMVGRLTRGDEEAGRLELLRSLPVGIHAHTAAALLTVAGMNAAIAALSAAALLAVGLPLAGSLVLAASFAVVGLFFAGAALVAAQVTASTRTVYGSAGALLGLAYLMRVIGDIGDGTLSWFSPIGLAQKARPYAGERWWPLLPLLIAAALLIALALLLATRRDHMSGLIAPRRARAAAAAGLAHPLGLAVRLQRGTLLGWAGGVLVTAIAFGSIAPTIDSFVANNKVMAEVLAGTGMGSLTDTYFATSLRLMALVAGGFAVQAALRLRSEESAQRAEVVLSTRVSRWHWAASHLVVAAAGGAALLAVAGLGTGVSYALAGGSWSQVPGLVGAALAYAPALWVMTAVAFAVFGVAPRLVDVAWGILAVYFVIGLLGDVLRLPGWVPKLSPFEQTPALPAAAFAPTSFAVLTVVAAVLVAGGIAGLRRRDIG